MGKFIPDSTLFHVLEEVTDLTLLKYFGLDSPGTLVVDETPEDSLGFPDLEEQRGARPLCPLVRGSGLVLRPTLVSREYFRTGVFGSLSHLTFLRCRVSVSPLFF